MLCECSKFLAMSNSTKRGVNYHIAYGPVLLTACAQEAAEEYTNDVVF